MYEVPVSPPLAFEEGDIIGYFQPDNDIAQINIYLEDSEIIRTYPDVVDDDQIQSMSTVFDLDTDADFVGEDYPLIAVETGKH